MSISFFAMRHQPDALFLTAVRRECDETAEMRERRHSATASVEKVFCSRQELSERGTMLVNFTDQGLKGVKDVPKSPPKRGQEHIAEGRVFGLPQRGQFRARG